MSEPVAGRQGVRLLQATGVPSAYALPLSLPSTPLPQFFLTLPAVHDALDPEMSILKQRIARRLRHEGHTDESVKGLDLGEWALREFTSNSTDS